MYVLFLPRQIVTNEAPIDARPRAPTQLFRSMKNNGRLNLEINANVLL